MSPTSNASAKNIINMTSESAVSSAMLPSRRVHARCWREAVLLVALGACIGRFPQQHHTRGIHRLRLGRTTRERLLVSTLDERGLFRVETAGRALRRLRVHVLLGEERARVA